MINTLYKLRLALQEIAFRLSSEWIPLKVDGKEIESVTLTDNFEVEIKTKQQ